MRRGKQISQGAHASMKVLLDNADEIHTDENCGWMIRCKQGDPLQEWLEGKFTKICVSVNSEEELLDIYHQAKDAGILCSLIQDSGATEFNGVPTHTVVAIGPDYPEKINPITGHLPLL